jgi:gas vesicle protein
MTGIRFLSFFGGFGVGIATALLLAPKSGGETRAVLKEQASEGTDYVLRQGAEVKNAIRDTIERGRLAVKTTAGGVADAFENGRAVLRG